jgi:putative aldouronate transport system permease protein
MKRKSKRKVPVFDLVIGAIMLIIIFITAYPFWNLAVISLNDAGDSMRGGLTFWPRVLSFESYRSIFSDNKDIVTAIFTSLQRTVLGTVINVSVSAWLAFVLSRNHFILRKFLSRYLVFTMYIGAGLIPTYLLYSKLGLINTFPVYIVPHMVSAYNTILILTYIKSLPATLTEAAQIDGASDMTLFIKIILPLVLPVLATVTLFISVFQWSQWQDTYFFASRNSSLTTLQYEMMKIIKQSAAKLSEQQMRDASTRSKISSESLQAAMVMVATVPILMVYPFVQKYFIKGMTLGSVKE